MLKRRMRRMRSLRAWCYLPPFWFPQRQARHSSQEATRPERFHPGSFNLRGFAHAGHDAQSSGSAAPVGLRFEGDQIGRAHLSLCRRMAHFSRRAECTVKWARKVSRCEIETSRRSPHASRMLPVRPLGKQLECPQPRWTCTEVIGMVILVHLAERRTAIFLALHFDKTSNSSQLRAGLHSNSPPGREGSSGGEQKRKIAKKQHRKSWNNTSGKLRSPHSNCRLILRGTRSRTHSAPIG